jgi:hypothetical protein
MITRLGWLTAVCAVAGVLAGCGSSKTATVTTQTTTPTTTATTATTTPAATTPTTAATTPTSTSPSVTASQLKAAEAANPAIKQEIARAIASCKTSVNSAPTLNSTDKAKLDAICDKAGTGDTAAVQKATAEVCQEIVKDSVPASAQTQALAACPKP